ncbi:hypothetical protein EMIT0196MI5_20360 [Pseudomonas sp. IT-196MI5]
MPGWAICRSGHDRSHCRKSPEVFSNHPVTADNSTLESTYFLFGFLLRVYQVIHDRVWPLSTMKPHNEKLT